MTAKELSEMLSGRSIGNEITRDEERMVADAGLAVVFGYSDDTMEFRGSIHDEVDSYGGGIAYLTKDGLFFDPDVCHKSACPHYAAARKTAKSINAVWHDEGGPCWTFETDIPHETFTIVEGGDPWCIGIVFNVEHLGT